MSPQINRSFHNRLMRRVQRHGHISTLFRAQDTTEQKDTVGRTQLSADGDYRDPGFVQATLDSMGTADTSVPALSPEIPRRREQRPVPASPAQTVTPRLVATPPAQAIQARQASKHASPVQGPAQPTTPPPVDQVDDAVSSAESRPVPESNATLTDSVWQRLQTIFKRHQNPQKPASPAVATGNQPVTNELQPERDTVVPTQVQDTPTELPASGPSRRPSSPHPTAADHRIQRSPAIEYEQVEQEHQSANDNTSDNIPQATQTTAGEAPTLQRKVSREGQPATPPAVADQPNNITQTTQHDTEQTISSRGDGNATTLVRPVADQTPASVHIDNQPATTQVRRTDGGTPPQKREEPSQVVEDQPSLVQDIDSSQQNTVDSGQAAGSVSSDLRHQVQRQLQSTPEPAPRPAAQISETMHARLENTENRSPVASTPPPMESEQPQPIPLQDVWQVERFGPESPHTVQSAGTPVRNERSRGTPLQNSIATLLASIESARPTSSAIEVVAPRSPRPIPLTRPGRADQTAVMRKVAPEQPGESPGHQQIREPEQHASRKTDGIVVDTSIGPLPADLWTLIDEPVPSTSRRPSTTGEQRGEQQQPASTARQSTSALQRASTRQNTAGSKPMAIQRLADDSSDRAAPHGQAQQDEIAQPITTGKQRLPHDVTQSVSSITAQSTTHIQRVAAPYREEAQTSSTEQRQTVSSDEGLAEQQQQQEEVAPESTVDIDDLARKVYAEVKRKLSIEWERLRTKF
ncbi:MAG: hypothetical protein P1S60_03840 [Anaerolineae bacterium]|nr:hypothetical protein [Anaerolineae bacterium]